MNPYQFLRELAGLPTGASPGGGGDGVRHEIQLNCIADLRTTAGLVLTAATTPSVEALETNALGVQAAASSNVLGTFLFDIPKDYDPSRDELTIRVVAVSGGTTNTPTLNATIYQSRAGKALSSALTTVASAAIPISTAHPAEVSIGVSGNSLRADDVLTVNLTSGAHTTDTVNIYSVDMVYRSNIVFTDMATR